MVTSMTKDEVVSEMRRIRRLTDKEQREEELNHVNAALWDASYDEVKAELGIQHTVSISAWVKQGSMVRARKERKNDSQSR